MNKTGMTSKQIAETCGVALRTVQTWAKKAGANSASVGAKSASAGHGRFARYTLEETIEIVRAGGRHTLAALLLENATRRRGEHRIDQLPNGTQLNQLRRIYGEYEAARRVAYIIGYSAREEVASPDFASSAFAQIRQQLEEKRRDDDQGRLDFNGGTT